MNYSPFIFVAIAVIAWYVLIILPQQKKSKERRAVIDALKPGDEVVTYGGIFATVKKVEENWVIVTVAKGVDIKVAKEAVVMRRDAGSEDYNPAGAKDTKPQKGKDAG